MVAAQVISFHRYPVSAGAAGGIALINSVSNLSGLAGPFAIGVLNHATGDFRTGLLLLAIVPFAGMRRLLRLRHAELLKLGAHDDLPRRALPIC